MPQPSLASPAVQSTPSEPTATCDVAIVGAGVTGMTIACALKDSGLRVISIDAAEREAAAARTQVYALTLLTGHIFDGIGVWERILPKICTFKQIHLSDRGRLGVQFETGDLGTEQLGYVAEHSVLLSALHEFADDRCSQLTWICPAQVQGVEYDSEGVNLHVEADGRSQTIRARVLLAADGKHSRIRGLAGIGTRGWKYWQSCITTKVRPQKGHGNIAYERFWPSGPFAILPLPGNRCNVVWTAPHAEAKALAALDDEQFLVELKKRYGEAMGEIEPIGERFVFPVQLMQSDRYVLPRLALVGDAAHCCHPVGGQGLNLGIRDAAAIAQILQEAHKNGEDLGSLKVLKRYERWRKGENLTILGFTDFLDRLFSNRWLPSVMLRQVGLWGLRHVSPLRRLALRLMTGQLGRHPQLVRR
ncbi:FAD-dependent hydroxylase [Oxynema sp. CENA135]|uniref:FAD-dependent hydroxylase n=1 Tax=Oxynema sp. CENA135 TaxID=984206 RepID=UPI001909B4EE|nr:FAD-dependent hydroxylase [Oxynema sp. CENA135]MBK4730252.1 FAD-dependent hydroxylase [Oxynema sp. CENA135]